MVIPELDKRYGGTTERMLEALRVVFDFIVAEAEKLPQNDRIQAIAGLLSSLDMHSNAIEEGSVYQSMQTTIAPLAERIPHMVGRLATPHSIDEAGPLECGKFVDSIISTVSANSQALHTRRDTVEALISIMGPLVKEKFAKAEHNGAYDDIFVIQDFQADMLMTAESDVARKVALNALSPTMRNAIGRSPLLSALAQYPLATDITAERYHEAVFDESHPQHTRALRTLRKFMVVTQPSEHSLYLAHMAQATDAFIVMPDKGSLMSVTDTARGRQRFNYLKSLHGQLYGAAGMMYLDTSLDHTIARLISGQANSLPPGEAPTLNKDYTVDQLPLPDGTIQRRMVERLPIAELTPNDVELPELTAEQLQQLNKLIAKMEADIAEATAGLHQNYMLTSPEAIIRVIPDTEVFPQALVTYINDQVATQLVVNQSSEVDSALTATADTNPSVKATLTALGLALLHDQLPTLRIGAEELQPAEPTQSDNSSTTSPKPPQPTDKPKVPQIRKTGGFVVFSPDGEIDAHTEITVTPAETDEDGATIMIDVDRAPHWADLAPQLTLQARETAIDTYLSEQAPPLDEPVAMALRKALTRDGGHTSSIRRIIEKLVATEHKGQRVLPMDFPAHAAIEQLTALEEQAYQHNLAEYIGGPTADSIGITINHIRNVQAYMNDPKQFPKEGRLPRYATIEQSIQKDRERMAAAGKVYAVPHRQRSTQTYQPYAHFQRNATITQPYTRVGKLAYVKGETAVEAVQAIIGLHTTQ